MSDTNRRVQSQKQARSLKFRIQEEEKLYYLRSENKGTGQLRSSAPWFSPRQKSVFVTTLLISFI